MRPCLWFPHQHRLPRTRGLLLKGCFSIPSQAGPLGTQQAPSHPVLLDERELRLSPGAKELLLRSSLEKERKVLEQRRPQTCRWRCVRTGLLRAGTSLGFSRVKESKRKQELSQEEGTQRKSQPCQLENKGPATPTPLPRIRELRQPRWDHQDLTAQGWTNSSHQPRYPREGGGRNLPLYRPAFSPPPLLAGRTATCASSLSPALPPPTSCWVLGATEGQLGSSGSET